VFIFDGLYEECMMTKKLSYEELEQKVNELKNKSMERRKVEEELWESEEKFRLLYERAPLGYQSLDGNGNIIEVNQAWLDTLGYTREEVVGKSFGDFLHPDWVDHFKQSFPHFKAVGEILGKEFEMVKKDGSRILVSFDGKIGRDEKGEFKQTHCIFHNITDSKRWEEALIESEARYKGIVEHTNNGVAVYKAVNDGEDFIFIDFNKASEKIEIIKREEILGKSVLEVFPGVKEFGLFGVFQRVWKSGISEHYPVSLYQDERIAGWRDNFVYKLPSGEIVAVYSDETERKQAEEALGKAHEELYNFSQELEKKVQERTKELREKTEKLIQAERLAATGKIANRVAHELRNPITVVGGFARRLNEKISDDDPNKRYLEIIQREVKVLETKVSEIIRLEEDEE
jgi:PAS domain S-box-containing protein